MAGKQSEGERDGRREEVDGEGKDEKGGKVGEERKKGRPSNAERLAREGRERANSTGGLKEYWKRGRDEEGEGERGVMVGLEGFKKSRWTRRSPVRERGEEEKDGGGLVGIVRKELREGLREVMEGIGESIREIVRKELRGLREELKEMDLKWREERKELGERMDKLEVRMQGLEVKEGESKVGENDGGEEERERIRRIERRLEMREREEKKRNLIVRGLRVEEGEEKGKVREMMKEIGVDGGVEEVRKVGGRGKELLMVKMESIEKKKEVLRKKKGIKDRKVWVEEDWTWEERRMRWNLKMRAEEESRRGKRVFVGYGGINVEGKWWKWDEEKGRVVEEGEGRGRKEGFGERGGGSMERGMREKAREG